MGDANLYWTKVAAIGQVAGAIATFLAVLVSLVIAFRSGRPKMRLRVGQRIVTDLVSEGAPDLLMFEVANAGDRPFHVRGIGWRTGWLRWGPQCLRRKAALQMIDSFGYIQSAQPPYELQPGAAKSSFKAIEAFLGAAHLRRTNPLFTRDWPLLGRRLTRVRAYAYTADGHEISAKPEKKFLLTMAELEKAALTPTVPPE